MVRRALAKTAVVIVFLYYGRRGGGGVIVIQANVAKKVGVYTDGEAHGMICMNLPQPAFSPVCLVLSFRARCARGRRLFTIVSFIAYIHHVVSGRAKRRLREQPAVLRPPCQPIFCQRQCALLHSVFRRGDTQITVTFS